MTATVRVRKVVNSFGILLTIAASPTRHANGRLKPPHIRCADDRLGR
jgi:hypothetical protein